VKADKIVSKISDIQVLRAFAVLIVMINHMAYGGHSRIFPKLLQYGSTGVDLFFVISGFVITRSALPMIERLPWRSFLYEFVVKRAFKIVPVALAWVAILCVSFGIVAALGDFRFPPNIKKEVPWILTLTYNYMAPGQPALAFGHYWTLMVEEHFYIVFALLFPFLIKRRMLVPVSIIAIVALWLWLRPYSSNQQFTHARFDGLLIGVLIAYLIPNGITLPRPVAIVANLMLMFAIWTCFAFPIPHAYSVVAIMAGLLVSIAAADINSVIPTDRYLRPVMLWIGERSYSLYLSHPLVMYGERFAFEMMSQHGLHLSMQIRAVLLTAAIMLVGAASYSLIERPSVAAGRRFLNARPMQQLKPAPAE